MGLLIITQKVDKDDSILGFFHRWIEEFAKHCESIIVICLEKGAYQLPANVKVFSLGKEEGRSWLKYLWRFYKYIWQERKNYDAVFVHMNQEYVLLGELPWLLLGKKVFMWRNHAQGNLLTRLAVLFSNKVFCTSSHSYTAKFRKTQIMPVGVDTDFFKPDTSIPRQPHSVLFLGRIAPVKRIEVLLDALIKLDKQGVDFTATVVGFPVVEEDRRYEIDLHERGRNLMQKKKLAFMPGISHSYAPELYAGNEIFVNMTPQGSFDKTIVEAMSSGISVIVPNHSLLPDTASDIGSLSVFKEGDPVDLAQKLLKLFKSPSEKTTDIRTRLRKAVISRHSLQLLINKIKEAISS